MFTSETFLRVRYAETDRMGYVYYGNYAQYFEVGRVEALRELGMNYRELEDSGIMLPVLDYQVKFFKPAYYDDHLKIVTYINKLPEVRFHFEYETYNSAGEKLNKGETTLVFVNSKTGKPCPPPEEILKNLKKYFE